MTQFGYVAEIAEVCEVNLVKWSEECDVDWYNCRLSSFVLYSYTYILLYVAKQNFTRKPS